MFRKYYYLLRKSDWMLSLIALFLVGFGMMALYSIESTGDEANFLNFKKQLIFFGVGIILMIFFSLLDYRYLRTYAIVFFVLGIIILITVLILGTTIRGTKGWIYFFGEQGFQPVELVKIFMIIILAKKFSDWRSEIINKKSLITIFALASPLIILVFLQPDFGSAIILTAIFIGMLLLTKIKKSYVIFLAVSFTILIIMSWLFVLQDYQKDRILTFLNPEHDPWGSGYNIKQSIIAVGSGNLFGRGLSLGPQSHLNFLPVQETDFIFSVIAEELGFIGSFLLIIFITLIIYRLVRIARLARDDFGIFVVSGIFIYIFVQSVLNIGMNIGILPVTGVPLPFVSYGGSSLIVSFTVLGIAQSIWIRYNTSIISR